MRMPLRRFRFTTRQMKRALVLGAAGLAIAGTIYAVPASAGTPPLKPSEQSLRALGARHGLYMGTAVDMAALNDATDPQYRALVASQFSTVTAENVMKWSELEP